MSNGPTDKSREQALEQLPTMAELLDEQEQQESGKGRLVEGIVAKVDEQFAYVDIGLKTEGAVPLTDFEEPDLVVPGLKVEVMVLRRGRGGDGEVEVSKRRADQVRLWDELKTCHEQGASISGIVRKAIKGGLLVEVAAGVEGFLPASLVDLKRVDNLDKYVGQEIEVEILEVHHKPRKKVVFSRKSVLDRERRDKRDSFLDKLNVGDTVVGTVKSVAQFGAFVDMGEGLQGLVHISNLSWFPVEDPKEVVKVGEEVHAKVIHLRREDGKISLSIKAAIDNPMVRARALFPMGQNVKGAVKSQTSAGVTVALDENYEGFCPSDHLAHEDEAVPVLAEGQELDWRVMEVRMDNPIIKLSLRKVREQEVRAETAEAMLKQNEDIIDTGSLMGDAFKAAMERQSQT